ncbi:MAG TPA: hypothetical protein VJI67_00990 [archaeon]|nr:hypothetical protein [archaeon]HLD80499.1 hypothetical protein [archaeon]
MPQLVKGKEGTINAKGNPTLDTILRIENTIKELDYYPTITQLWKALPRGATYQNYKAALSYLVASNKVLYAKGKLFWIFVDSPKKERLWLESREP